MKPDTTRIAGVVARELAYRAAARAYVEGRIDRVGDAYSIVLQALAADDDHVVASTSGIAANEGTLLATGDRLGGELRAQLAKKKEAVRADRTSEPIITSSFDAYVKPVQARDLLSQQGEYAAGQRLVRQALKLDPDCAEAWALLWMVHGARGFPDSARIACDEMMRRSDWLTEEKRLYYEATARGGMFCDPEGAFRLWDALAGLAPKYRWSFNRGALLAGLGRIDEAQEVFAHQTPSCSIRFTRSPVSDRWSLLRLLCAPTGGGTERLRSAPRAGGAPRSEARTRPR